MTVADLVDPVAVARIAGVPSDAASDAATTAGTYVLAYCTRLRPGAPVPLVVERVALALAVRLASNPKALRGASTEGQTIDHAPVGLTYLESVLLNSYRLRTA